MGKVHIRRNMSFLKSRVYVFGLCLCVCFVLRGVSAVKVCLLLPLFRSIKMAQDTPPDTTPPATPRAPPIITAFQTQANNLLSERPWRRYVPDFADHHIVSAVAQFFDDVLDQHRCSRCRAMLCCGQHIFHEDGCWAMELQPGLTYHDVDSIYSYRSRVFRGAMDGWSDWAFDFFDVERHNVSPFMPHHYGFYIRCFSCPRCGDGVCRATHHDHTRTQ